MSSGRSTRTPRSLATIALLAASAALAQAPSVEQCVASSEAGQVSQKQGSLSEARRALERCAVPACPQPVRDDCTRWLGQVLAAMPTIIVVARAHGVDQRQVRVWLDGHLWLSELNGRPAELDPGEHTLELATERGTVGDRLIINTGEKDRLVVFSLDGTAAAPVAEATQARPSAVALARPFPAAAVVTTATTVIGAGLFAGLGLGGKARLKQLTESPCAATKTCDPAGTDEVRRLFAAADISLGVGALSAAAAIVFWWQWAAQPPPLQPAVAPLPGGGAALLLNGAF